MTDDNLRARSSAPEARETLNPAFEEWLNERNLLPNGAWDWPSIIAMLNHHEDALVAPEAREGEAVGLDEAQRKAVERAAMDAGAYSWRNARLAMVEGKNIIGYPAFSRADMAELARLTNVTTVLPAAPSADKLRIAVEALEKIRLGDVEVLDDELGVMVEVSASSDELSEIADPALAALQAEGKS